MSLSNPELLNLPRNLVKSYRRFYRASTRYNPSTRSILKPMTTARETIKHLAPTLSKLRSQSLEEYANVLKDAVSAALDKDLRAIRENKAGGFINIKDISLQTVEVKEFAKLYVEDLFIHHLQSNTENLYSERSIGLIEDTCEFIYRLMQDRENEILRNKDPKELKGDLGFDETAYEDKWVITYPSEEELLIEGPGLLEILISNKRKADYDTTENEYFSQETIRQQVEGFLNLELIITTNELKSLCKLYLGTKVSWSVPYKFAVKLKNLLLKVESIPEIEMDFEENSLLEEETNFD